ncbi:hypothetical protein CROQUDRAFT_104655 [Cronartium quercuum f. sp. fusiforme G11]|uniref:RNase H type-1 domain-containing protein n=1 Tax=Cronartium quercuum f. sp. fusiforme G11 TaxID=708437 RepID=A0A9P6TF09_9BASI|nr:hypothetical protein CROQUDRAFT_104655 [Cronartium quercuum f. sp. fusiforme G11]
MSVGGLKNELILGIGPYRESLTPISALHPTQSTFTVVAPSSPNPEEGVGSAALHVETDTSLQLSLGSEHEHTAYAAKLVGLSLATVLAKASALSTTTNVFLLIDNPAYIQRLYPSLPLVTVHIFWCPGYEGIESNEGVDQLAREVIKFEDILDLPASLLSVKQLINAKLKDSVTNPPLVPILTRIRSVYNPHKTCKALASRSRGLATSIVQLQASHTPSNNYVHWCKTPIHYGHETRVIKYEK